MKYQITFLIIVFASAFLGILFAVFKNNHTAIARIFVKEK